MLQLQVNVIIHIEWMFNKVYIIAYEMNKELFSAHQENPEYPLLHYRKIYPPVEFDIPNRHKSYNKNHKKNLNMHNFPNRKYMNSLQNVDRLIHKTFQSSFKNIVCHLHKNTE